jgi:peptidoglycan/xylan/chitin deacetylase (PgdA/CDA1 family)
MSGLVPVVSAFGRLLPGTRAGRLLILIYHRVHATPDPMFPGEVDAVKFDWQMRLLKRHCAPVSLSEGVERLRRGDLPPRAVAVTFDDGYADNATVALPILQRHGVNATFFVAPGFLDGGRMWNDSVIESLRRAITDRLDLDRLGLGTLRLDDARARGAAAEHVLGAIKHREYSERSRLVEEICGTVGQPLPDDLMMTRTQVRELADAGMGIGAHTMTHPILRTLPDAAARTEIEGSRAELERIIDRPIRAFAYPNGRPGEDYGDRDRRLVESLGFDFAVSTRKAVARRTSDVFQLPRFTPWDSSPERWLGRLLTIYSGALRQ